MIPKIKPFRLVTLLLCAVGVLLMPCIGVADSTQPRADSEAVNGLIRSLAGVEVEDSPVLYTNKDGTVRFLAAPQYAYFRSPRTADKGLATVEQTALNFITAHGDAFGIDTEATQLRFQRIVPQEEHQFVRFDQYLIGAGQAYEIYGAQVVVHLDGTSNVVNVNAGVLRNVQALAKDNKALTPQLDEEQAIHKALAYYDEAGGDAVYAPLEDPVLVLFGPELFGMPGDPQLAWKVVLGSDDATEQGMIFLIQAQTGALLLRHVEQPSARNREIYDTKGDPDLLNAKRVRRENEGAAGKEQIDTAYDYFGDCYNFYMNQHGRDSYDNLGSPIRVYINYPIENAFWHSELNIMVIGEQLLADDVVAHEFTHGVTQYETDLFYYSYAGAISEMFSDAWGEFIDLTNGRGNDSSAVRWLIGEDMPDLWSDDRGSSQSNEARVRPADASIPMGAIRSMKDPTLFGDPDRLGSPFLRDPYSRSAYGDLGGVHSNCGVGNKMIYLLTDGDTFNGETVYGMGIPKVADLFYAARPMLSKTADYYELFFALRAAGTMLGFSAQEQANIVAAARAVEIVPPDTTILTTIQPPTNFRALPIFTTSGKAVVGLKWKAPSIDFLETLPVQYGLYRSVIGFPTGPLDGEMLPLDTSETAYLDQNVNEGDVYYYTLVSDIPSLLSHKMYAKVHVGSAGLPVLTESFGTDPYLGSNPFDLSYSQLLFQPVMAPPPLADDDAYLKAMDFTDYEVTFTPNVYNLPIKRSGGSITLPMTDDGVASLPLNGKVFPFFGVPYSEVYLSSNGTLIFLDLESLFGNESVGTLLDIPTLAAHFALPRISFLFADLAPHIGGAIWAKELDDRIVVSFENVAVKPGADNYGSNVGRITAQVELFDSGTIRITYLNTDVDGGIVGLSDGRGVPEELTSLYGDIYESLLWVDFSRFNSELSGMSIKTLSTQIVQFGEEIRFDVDVELPSTMTGTPLLVAQWDGPGVVPFTDLRNGTGLFLWRPSFEDAGSYTVRIVAELHGERVFQDVRLIVHRGNYDVKPQVLNLVLSTDVAGEDVAVNRAAPIGTPLYASFEYYHPYADDVPLLYGEGPSTVYWFRNGQLVPNFTNMLTVSSGVTGADESWYVTVIPTSNSGLQGNPVASRQVHIIGVPEIHEVTPDQDITVGGNRVTLRGKGFTDVIAVTFDGVPGTSIHIHNSTELSVVTPTHAAGSVSVAVETLGGIGRKLDAFTFIADEPDPREEGKVRSFMGCGRSNEYSAGWIQDFVPAIVVLLLLGVYRVSRRLRTN
ncbi:MAG: M4 family metallopeptidase [Candidatus Hydrogenedentales bacterium]